MRPRLVFRTHYQVDEPAYLRLLVNACSSPVQSAYDETIADKVAREIRRRVKNFNVAAGGYVVDLAHGLGILNEQNVWTPTGHLIGLLSPIQDGTGDEQLSLTYAERLVYLRIFLEGDGAALTFLARQLLEHERLPASDSDWNGLAQRMFVQIYDEYLKLAGTTADRVALRTEIERIRKRGYTGKSGAHKLFVHLQTMCRVGLIERAADSGLRRYARGTASEHDALKELLEAVPTLYDLEQIARDERWMDVACSVLGIRVTGTEPDLRELWAELATIYRRILARGIPLCPLSTLIEAAQVSRATETKELLPYAVIRRMIEDSQQTSPADIRFHVDRRGRPAFLKLSDEFLSTQLAPTV